MYVCICFIVVSTEVECLQEKGGKVLISDKYMSEEETDNDNNDNVKCRPVWRSDGLL